MKAFYRVIISEKTLSKEAARVIIKETETMIEATGKLFSAIEDEGIAVFENRDDESLAFALLIHSVLDLRLDAKMAESNIAYGMIERMVDSFIEKLLFKSAETPRLCRGKEPIMKKILLCNKLLGLYGIIML